MSSKTIIGVATVILAGIITFVCVLLNSADYDEDIDPSANTPAGYTAEDAASQLQNGVGQVRLTENMASKGVITFEDTSTTSELPNIDTAAPITVKPVGKDIVIEIFSSPEKAGSGTDGWLVEMAESFNRSNQTVNGKSVGIAVRSMTSGLQLDYIVSGQHMPDAFSPSASMWADMAEYEGVDIVLINDRMVGNVAGVLIDKGTYNDLNKKYDKVDIETIVSATEAGDITAGYTNPFTSTAGLNFLASTLYYYDAANPLSSEAVDGFNKFQNNVPFVAYNTLQMRDAAENNTFSTFILEYQGFYNNSELVNNYEFLPFGIRHDNPLYAIASIDADKMEGLKMFNEYCSTDEAYKLASKYGFNQMNDYKASIPETDGNTWIQMQKTWKKNKNTSKPIAAVFVLDTSGSMSGEPMNALKVSLNNSIKYINSSNYIGVVSYASSVNVDLPIGLFDINQQAYFQGAVAGLNANGGTATYSALSQAVIMLNSFMEENPDVEPMIFLLSDGVCNEGAKLSEISEALKYYSIPVYTIGYNADLEQLKKVSSLNEAASIDADSDDVVYQLKNLFNANL